ncbi:small-conductance mechanosensitive channel [Chthonomonas calidirosea]|uniref:Spy/CpxP family protein refolding chaperone n=1 Tax=Chthonomonas calidirosea TaxID=454171 RepID=UPI0006DD426B|nr:Spy/CpxP family protein refolding chaperone [Chthonomonas calidirosea]CEK18906.1 small-conductance mechanosensitive channel [Chthonomonas calidirosea]
MKRTECLLTTTLLGIGIAFGMPVAKAQKIIPPPNGNKNSYVYTPVPFNGYWTPTTGFFLPWAVPFGGYYNYPNFYFQGYPYQGTPGAPYQGFGRQRGNFQGRNGNFRLRAQAGFAMFQNIMSQLPQQGPLFLDPTRSNEALLLRRDDVRHELLLSGDQQNQLNQLIIGVQRDTFTQVANAWRQNIQQNRQNLRDMTPEERRAFFQQQGQQMETTVAKITDQEDAKLEAVLDNWQKNRLHQLDLQWRTAMALSDDKVADKLNLTPDQRAAIKKIANDFRQLQRQTLMALFQPNNTNEVAANGAVPGQQPPIPGPQGPPRFDPAQLQQIMATLPDRAKQAEAKMYKARIEYGNKALAVLTPEQRAQWQTLLGKPFYFNPNTLDDVALAQQQQ